jgi:hypothetical protein
VHTADPGTWNRLSGKLDALDAEAVYQEKLQELPVHSPDQGLWATINQRLNRATYFKTAVRVALSAAAGLLLFFTVSRISDYYTNSPAASQVARHDQSKAPITASKQTNAATPLDVQTVNNDVSQAVKNTVNKNAVIKAPIQTSTLKSNEKSNSAGVDKSTLTYSSGIQDLFKDETSPVIALTDSETAPDMLTPVTKENTAQPFSKYTSFRESALSLNKSMNTEFGLNGTDKPKGQITQPLVLPVTYDLPKDPETGDKANNFALAMGYFPENIDNGTDNSVFYNVDLTASYNKEKVRFNTSVGMAYNEEQFEVNMNYDIKSPVTAFGPGGRIDTVAYNSASLQSDYVGSEKHQYFTYNLGFGRRLFSYRKFSTWINAGAGFGLKLNNPDLVAETENSIKNQYSAQITQVSTDRPVYNDLNVSFITGIDFNYRFLNKLSFTFTPTSRWYFKPVLSKNNQPTDELTLGFKTGIKFDF